MGQNSCQRLFGPFVGLYDPLGDFGILSNFAKVEFSAEGLVFQTVEHFFQSKKFSQEEFQAAVRDADSGIDAKRLAWSKQFSEHVRADWDDVRLSVMRQGLLAKFEQSRLACEVLCSTWPLPLVDNSPDDEFWGRGANGGGANHLGRLLEEIRSILANKKTNLRIADLARAKFDRKSSYGWAALEADGLWELQSVPPLAYEGFVKIDIPQSLSVLLEQVGDRSRDVSEERLLSYARLLDAKYSNYTWFQDSRSAVSNWKLQFLGVLLETMRKAAVSDQKIVAVGAGAADESSQVWADFGDRVTLVDWGHALVENCRTQAPNASVKRCRAERLDQIDDRSADVYCALRTYDSSVLDATAALSEATRVVRPGGVVILSVSNGYLRRDGSIEHGQIVEGGKLDKFRPWQKVLELSDTAHHMGFRNFELYNLTSEIVLAFQPRS